MAITPEVKAYRREIRFIKMIGRPTETGCLPWLGARSPQGYGKFQGGWAHRFAYEMKHGPIPEGMVIDHLCRTPSCVKIAHLEAVTPAENQMRGVSPWAVNARKTHCKHGHAFTGRYSNGKRYCQRCDTIRHQARAENDRRGYPSGYPLDPAVLFWLRAGSFLDSDFTDEVVAGGRVELPTKGL